MEKKGNKSKNVRWDVRKAAREFLKTGREKMDHLDLQPVWDRTKKEIQAAMKSVEKGTEKAAERALDFGKRAGFQSQMYMTQLKLQRALVDLGTRVYELNKSRAKTLSVKDTKALGMIKKVRDFDKQISSFKRKAKGPAGAKRTKATKKK